MKKMISKLGHYLCWILLMMPGIGLAVSGCALGNPLAAETVVSVPTTPPTLTASSAAPIDTPTHTETPMTSTGTPMPASSQTATAAPATALPSWAAGAPMVRVPAGEFSMGTSYEGVIKLQQQLNEKYARDKGWYLSSDAFAVEMPQRIVYLNEFFIDKYEVTNARYRGCVEAGACNPPSDNSSMTCEHYYDDPAYDDYPVVRVGWADADAYCRWAGRRLPTEAEWEKAARGTDGWLWPWGNEWDESKANTSMRAGDTTRVGSYPRGASPYGAMDMAGNVEEWVEDWAQLYPSNSFQLENIPKAKIMRGGAFFSEDEVYVRTAIRDAGDPTDRADPTIGFRCAVGGPHPTPEPTATPRPTNTPDASRAMVHVPAGEFLMGSQEDDLGARYDEKPQHKVYLDAFDIDKYEVTYAQYAEFLNEIGRHRWSCNGHDCTRVRGEDGGGQFTHILYEAGKYVVEPGYETYPVGFVSWYGAKAYCERYGMQLPTEAEWEKAARGTGERIWPWGNEWDPAKVTTSGDLLHGVRDVAPVGSKPEGASPYGALDMAGNVEEWVADWWAPDYYSRSPYRNPLGPDTGEDKVLRSGQIAKKDGSGVRTTRRHLTGPDSTLTDAGGFRCAYSNTQP